MSSDPRLHYLADKTYRVGVCLHESSHSEYMERLGDLYVEFIPLPSGEYHTADALVTNRKSKSDDYAMKSDLLGYVKSIIAGGLVADGGACPYEKVNHRVGRKGKPSESVALASPAQLEAVEAF
jgi:hypothetical protein